MADIVRVKPESFRLDTSVAIIDVLNSKYSNKVIPNLGLGIRVHQLLSYGDLVVHACQDGSYQTTVQFTLVLFRPAVGQVLLGKIKDCCATKGLRITLDFFDDIRIPPDFLMAGTEYDASEGVYVWKYEDNDLFMDPDEPIRFRVESDVFEDVGPIGVEDAPAPYTILVL